MSDIYPKFIISGDYLRMDKVTYHKQLLNQGDKVNGGGLFSFNADDKSFTFYGESFDFGKAKMEDIWNAVRKGNVGPPRAPKRYETYKFYYRNECGEITELAKNV